MILGTTKTVENGTIRLNDQAKQLFERLHRSRMHLQEHRLENGATIWDFKSGGLAAGQLLSEVCLAGYADVAVTQCDQQIWQGPAVQILTDHPVEACMASQYAGWQISQGDFFGMGSGPMRAAAANEKIYESIGHTEKPNSVVGVIETGQLPTDEVASYIAKECDVPASEVTLLVAPTASQPGAIQIVARSVETALHKMFELGFRLECVVSGFGSAPLPPVAKNDLAGIGRTNDAVLYGANVVLWVRCEDEAIAEIIEKIPSRSSSDYGAPFGEIFKRYDHDFYKIDPHLFSPAKISINNLESGRIFQAGECRPDLIQKSFLA